MKSNLNNSITAIIVAAIIGLSILGFGFLNYEVKMQELHDETQKQELKDQSERHAEEKNIRIRQECQSSAETSAKKLVKKKAQLDGGEQYKNFVDNELFLKADFDKYYEDCLSINGLKK